MVLTQTLKAPQVQGYTVRMDIAGIVAEIDLEIARLEKAKALLTSTTTAAKAPKTTKGRKSAKATSFSFGTNARPLRKISAEGRARIAAAQKARWAKAKKA